MADLELKPEIRQEKREYSIQEIFRLAEKFRHLAKDLSEVFIQSSRQGLIHQIETDPEEEELKEELGFVGALAKRLKTRHQRREFKKLTLVKAATKSVQELPKKTVEPVKAVAAPVQVKVTPVVTPSVEREVKTEIYREETKPKPAAAGSLLDAARGFNSQIEGVTKPAVEAVEDLKESSGISPLQLSTEELPKYKKYADIGQQLLEGRQLPHFKTLIEKAKTELSPLGVQLLEELAKKAGF